ncbi:hypothetical protein SASPL_112406 [Salvia splendens]|uniref:Disease resistance R13L4/SHOC-2-like LRR domain-containing protein n=1 Tax=Salvia splendens TaxID=180675 RepID=A0A8X9A469_SALSN|nr:hypothetical protein SASPL_112406 [Salvia splendens]
MEEAVVAVALGTLRDLLLEEGRLIVGVGGQVQVQLKEIKCLLRDAASKQHQSQTHAFLVRNLKSKILVTTPKQNVAEIGFSVELGLLSSEDSWELLKKKAFLHKKNPGRHKPDETIYAPDLYRMWIAQGLILDENFKGNDATLPDMAELYLELQLEHDELTVTSAEDSRKHLRSLEILSDIEKRTIEFPPQSIVDFWKFKLLRGLVILRFKFADRKLPMGITDLVHLRYLRLRECGLDSLPYSISNLAYLDTLDLYLSRNVLVPNVLSKMSRLKHLLLPLYDKEKIGNYRLKLDDCADELESLIGSYECHRNKVEQVIILHRFNQEGLRIHKK